MLRATNKRAEKGKLELTKQNNQLKELVTKHKGGRQCCFDLALLFVFLFEFATLIKIL
jgi:hypothetical protein